MLQATGLKKSFGSRVAVNDVSFEIRKGSCFGLLGPNGAGKTTTISMLVGILAPDAGQVALDGKPVKFGESWFKRKIGFIPQDIALYEELSAERNLRFFGTVYGLTGEELNRRIGAVLEVANLSDRAKEPVSKFSGGMKRRLNIATGLLHDPDLVVLDEPTVGVDPQSRNAIFDALEALLANGKTLLYTTHYMEEVERLCDDVAIVDNGRVVAQGSLKDLVGGSQERRRIDIELANDREPNLAPICSALGVSSAAWSAPVLSVESDSFGPALEVTLAVLREQALTVVSVNSNRQSLESVFLSLTGRNLRD